MRGTSFLRLPGALSASLLAVCLLVLTTGCSARQVGAPTPELATKRFIIALASGDRPSLDSVVAGFPLSSDRVAALRLELLGARRPLALTDVSASVDPEEQGVVPVIVDDVLRADGRATRGTTGVFVITQKRGTTWFVVQASHFGLPPADDEDDSE